MYYGQVVFGQLTNYKRTTCLAVNSLVLGLRDQPGLKLRSRIAMPYEVRASELTHGSDRRVFARPSRGYRAENTVVNLESICLGPKALQISAFRVSKQRLRMYVPEFAGEGDRFE